jgi:hypothetical protein
MYVTLDNNLKSILCCPFCKSDVSFQKGEILGDRLSENSGTTPIHSKPIGGGINVWNADFPSPRLCWIPAMDMKI